MYAISAGISSSTIPVFGSNKKRQRHAVYASPANLPTSSITHNQSQSQRFNNNNNKQFYREQFVNDDAFYENASNTKYSKQENYGATANNNRHTSFGNKLTKKGSASVVFTPQNQSINGSNLNNCFINTNDSRITNSTPKNIKRAPFEEAPVIPTEKPIVIPTKRAATNNTPKLITTSIQGLEVWKRSMSNTTALYEICGTLESTISRYQYQLDKTFSIKDGSGRINCIFWEIDRKLLQTPRGSVLRCIGRFSDDVFHCISVRRVKENETKLLQYLVDVCETQFQKTLKLNEI